MTSSLGTPRELVSHDEIDALLEETRRVAVLGIKTEAKSDQPAFYVPRYLVEVGLDVVPVPVYFPEAVEILGRPVVRALADVKPPADLVNVFRRAKDLPAHVADILAARPRCVWLQLGIKEAAFTAHLVSEGIFVVQNRCLMVEHRRWVASKRR